MKKKLRELISKKYQRAKIDKKFFNSYFKLYPKFEIIEKRKVLNNSKYMNVEFFFENLKKKLFEKEKDIIFSLYKKFSFNLKIKLNYDKNFRKKSNKDIKSEYLIDLSYHVIDLNKINKLHKLNLILKAFDNLILKKNLKVTNDQYKKYLTVINYRDTTIKRLSEL